MNEFEFVKYRSIKSKFSSSALCCYTAAVYKDCAAHLNLDKNIIDFIMHLLQISPDKWGMITLCDIRSL